MRSNANANEPDTDTWLCTYHGAPSEGLHNEEAQRRVDHPATRAELLRLHGGGDDAGFRQFLSEQCYDLHYAALSQARPFSFGPGNLWRIATEWPVLSGAALYTSRAWQISQPVTAMVDD